MSRSNALMAMVLCALITYFYRSVPFIAFSGKRKMPAALERLGKLLPAAIMMILVVYSFRSLPTADGHTALCMIVAAFVTGIIHVVKKNTILSVFAGTFVYIFLLNFF